MSGIEILSSTEVVTSSELNWTAFWGVLAICTGLSLVVGLVATLSSFDSSYLYSALTVGLMTGACFGMLAADSFARPTEYETQYQVLISDEISLKDFNEKYQIISQEGKIYTIREKE